MRRRDFIKLFAGAVFQWPLAVNAQNSGKIPKIGVLWHAGNADEEGPYYRALLEGLKDLGFVDGVNIKLEHRFPNETPKLFESMAAELVAKNVDVLACVGNVACPYAKNATASIPIVFMLVSDPIGMNLVESIARPGGNITGLSTYSTDVTGRRLQILKEAVPGLSRIAQLVNPSAKAHRLHIELTRTAAAELGLDVRTFDARAPNQLEAAFDAMKNAGMQAATVNPEGLAFQARSIIAELALSRRIALCTYSRETFEPGAFMTYGTDQRTICRRAAFYVEKILKGAKPQELPVEGPTRFEFLLNMKTANALGIEVPQSVIARADEVIE